MKNNVVKALALLLSVNCCFPGMIVKAEEPDEKTDAKMNLLQGSDFEGFDNQNQMFQEFFGIGIAEVPQIDSNDIPLLEYQGSSEEEDNLEAKRLTEVNSGEKNTANKANTEPVDTGLRRLQIPQKLEVVIDPWEMDGKGQIYSEEYVIRNDGETPGMLTLSNLACRPQEQSGVIVRADKEGLHDSEDKLIYLEMFLGSEERIVFSKDNSQYQIELEPGEELTVCFGGEVNENASRKWGNNDIAVSVVYSWEREEKKDKKAEELEENQQGEGSEKEKNSNVDDVSSEEVDEQEISEENLEDGKGLPTNESYLENTNKEGDEIKYIELQESQNDDVVIDSWRVDEEGKIISPEYILQNIGDSEGIWSLSGLVCKSQEQSEIKISTDKKEIQNNDMRSIYLELVLEKGEDIVLPQENLLYEVKLKPGERVSVCFVGEMNGNTLRAGEKAEIVVTAMRSWNMERKVEE